MEDTRVPEDAAVPTSHASVPTRPTEAVSPAVVTPQGSTPGSCPSCAGSQSTRAILPPPYVYAIGQLQPQYPNLSVEKEVAQAIGRGVTTDLTDREALVEVLQDKRNRYLVRQLCWLLIVRGLETYLLKPYDPADYDELVRAYAADPKGFVVVVGYRGGTANPQDCNGVILPILIFDNIYFGSKESLLTVLEAPEKVEAARFAAAAGEMFDRIVDQIADDGSSDDSRAKLYLAMRSPDIYREAAAATVKGLSLRAIRTRPFVLNRTGKNIEVIFDYVDRKTNSLEQYSTVVNVDGMYPYLVRELAPYFEH
jgi:hypothetical protein